MFLQHNSQARMSKNGADITKFTRYNQINGNPEMTTQETLKKPKNFQNDNNQKSEDGKGFQEKLTTTVKSKWNQRSKNLLLCEKRWWSMN